MVSGDKQAAVSQLTNRELDSAKLLYHNNLNLSNRQSSNE